MPEPSTVAVLLARIASTLEAHGIPYMVIGGHAAMLYGEPRLTRDIDITVARGLDQLDELVRVVRALGLVPAPGAEDLARRNYVLPCTDPTTRMDVTIILSVSAYEQEAMTRTRVVPTGGVPVRFASPEDVLIHKIVAGRARETEDARAILARAQSLDRPYIVRWLAAFEQTLSSPLVRVFRDLDEQVNPR